MEPLTFPVVGHHCSQMGSRCMMSITSDSALTPQHPYFGKVCKNEYSCSYRGFLVHEVQLLRHSSCNESGAKDGHTSLCDEV